MTTTTSRLEEMSHDDYIALAMLCLVRRLGIDPTELEHEMHKFWAAEQHQQHTQHHDDQELLTGGEGMPLDTVLTPDNSEAHGDAELAPVALDVSTPAQLTLTGDAWVYADAYEKFIDAGGQVNTAGHRLVALPRPAPRSPVAQDLAGLS